MNTGCVQEEKQLVEPPPSPVEETITLYFRDASRPPTRALNDSLETIVKTVDVLAFKAEYSQFLFAYRKSVNEADMRSVAGDYTRKEFTLIVEKDNARYHYVLLANARTEVDEYMKNGIHDREPEERFLSGIISVNTAVWNTAPGNPAFRYIPMCGESPGDGKTIEQLDQTEIELYRSMVRVDVRIDGGVPFTLKEVYVYNRPARGRIAPRPGAWDPEQNRFIAPSLPDSLDLKNPVGQAPSDPSYTVTANAVVHEIYLYETREQTTQAFANATFLVLGGTYKGKMNYYRLDFEEKRDPLPDPTFPSDWWNNGPPASGQGEDGMVGAGSIYHPLIRNHHYELAITGVRGPGFASPKEASESISTQLLSELLTWENRNENIIIDNAPYTLTVKPSVLAISATGTAEAELKTTYPNPSWALSEPTADWLRCTLDTEANKIKVAYNTAAARPPKGSEAYFRLLLKDAAGSGKTLVSQQIKVTFE
jgi:hypothetical protein